MTKWTKMTAEAVQLLNAIRNGDNDIFAVEDNPVGWAALEANYPVYRWGMRAYFACVTCLEAGEREPATKGDLCDVCHEIAEDTL